MSISFMHWYPLPAQIQVCLFGHTIYRVTVLRPAALMQRPGCEPESLIATQRRPVAKKKNHVNFIAWKTVSVNLTSLTTLLCPTIILFTFLPIPLKSEGMALSLACTSSSPSRIGRNLNAHCRTFMLAAHFLESKGHTLDTSSASMGRRPCRGFGVGMQSRRNPHYLQVHGVVSQRMAPSSGNFSPPPPLSGPTGGLRRSRGSFTPMH